MEEKIILASSVEEGLRYAEQLLHRPRTELEVEVLQEGRQLFFGLFRTPYKLKIRLRDEEFNRREAKKAKEIERMLEEVLQSLEDLDGYYNISFSPEGVWLTVHPPRGKGRPVAATEVYRKIEELGLEGVDHGLITRILREGNANPVLIAIPQPAKLETVVTVSPDGLEAYLTLKEPREGRPVRVEELHQALREAGITYGIDQQALENIIINLQYDAPVLVARGLAPVNGKDATVEYLFQRPGSQGEQLPETSEKVDYRDLSRIPSVYAGQLLARRIPPTPGRPGMTVRGEPLPPREARNLRLIAGSNVELSEDGNSLYATTEGRVVETRGTISVSPVHVVYGDVDYSTGNIDFAGCVIVAGSVKGGFRVRAEGSVEIRSNVEDAIIEAGGNVTVRGGYIGKNRGIIRSGGDVVVKFIENGHVIARGDVLVGHAVMHSQVTSGGRVVVSGKGYVTGGVVRARTSIRAKTVGSRVETRTQLEIGINFSVYEACHSKEYTLEDKREKLTRVDRVLALLEQRPEMEREGARRLRLAREQLVGDIGELEKEIEELKSSSRWRWGGYLEVTESINPGTRLIIDGVSLTVRERLGPGTFRENGGKVEKVV